jgi:hypothetical protein
MPQTLGQVVAAEAAARSEANKRTGAIHKQGQKPDLFEGFDRTYAPFATLADGTEDLSLQRPPQGTRVQVRAEKLIRDFMDELQPAIDLAASKDEANCKARADVLIDGEVLLSAVPATHLLHMEKVLEDIGTFIAKLPVRDPSVHWEDSAEDSLAHSGPTFTNSEEVQTKAMIVVPATREHAGTGTTYQERVAVGRWTTVRHTGALTAERKRRLEGRVAILKVAFRQAREAANRAEALELHEADTLFGYILG